MKFYKNINPMSDWYGHVGYYIHRAPRYDFGEKTIIIRTWNRTIGWEKAIWRASEWEKFHIRLSKHARSQYVIAYNSLLR